MNRSLFLILLLALFTSTVEAQKRKTAGKPISKSTARQNQPEPAGKGIVVDERLAVLRAEPSLFARPLQRMRRGRVVLITGLREADGVRFYRVQAVPKAAGWVQTDAVISRAQTGDDQRLARLVLASQGFEQVERTRIFLENFPDSPLRPSILLLFGDLMEEIALRLSTEAARRLSRREMAASGAPLHSFYLNYASLDRYGRLGISFLFNPQTRTFHYDGRAWREVVEKHPQAGEAVEAQKRLEALKEKMIAVRR